MKNSNYEIMDYTSIRYPILPLNTYRNIENDDNYNYINNYTEEEQSLIKSGIIISSKDLYDRMLKEKDNYKINRSLMKYINRSTTRSTPFGLHSVSSFSKIEINEDTTTIIKKFNNIKIYFHIDFVWLNEVIEQIVSNTEILPYLKVKVNPLIYKEENIIYNYMSSDKKKIISNELLDEVINTANEFIPFKLLFSKVKNLIDDDIPQIDIYKWLMSLLNKKIIVSELSMYPNDSKYLDYILNILEKNPAANIYFTKLYNIKNILDNLGDLDERSLLICLETVINKMSKLHVSKSYICAVCNDQDTKLSLSKRHYNEICELVELLSNITYYCHTNSKLNKYRNRFVEKYGYHREISISSLINKNKGLGWPDYFTNNDEDIYEGKNALRFKSLLLELLYENDDRGSIDLSDKRIATFFSSLNGKDNKKIATSFELSFVSSNNSKKIYLAPSIGSTQIGKYAGRFTPAYNKTQFLDYSYMCNRLIEYYKNGNVNLVDLKFPFENKTVSNITINNFTTDINCSPLENNNQQLSFNDILVGVDRNNNFYFKNKNNNERIKFVTFNALNPHCDDKLFRLLLDLTAEEAPLYGISALYREFLLMKTIPRFVYKNIVLYPKTYKLYTKDYKSLNDLEMDLINRIKEEYIYLKMGDNRLLLNTSKKEHIKYLYDFMKKKTQITITEVEEDIIEALKNPLNNGINEFTLSFINKHPLDNSLLPNNKYDCVKYDDRNKSVFSSWIYLKIYINREDQNEILKRYILPLFERYKDDANISNMFYILYNDQRDHIRLRINCRDKNMVMNKVGKYFEPLLEQGIISNINLDNYEREVERYGGLQSIEKAENYFMYDSYVALKLLELNLSNEDKILYTTILMIKTMNEFGLDFWDCQKMFENIQKDKYRSEYIKYRQKFKKVIKNKEDDIILNNLFDSLCLRNKAILLYTNSLENYKFDILGSCLHMFCNRIYGIDKNKETMSYAFARHLLHDFEYEYRRIISKD